MRFKSSQNQQALWHREEDDLFKNILTEILNLNFIYQLIYLL